MTIDIAKLRAADTDGDGYVSKDEMRALLIENGLSASVADTHCRDYFAYKQTDKVLLENFISQYLRMTMFKIMTKFREHKETTKEMFIKEFQNEIGTEGAKILADQVFSQADGDGNDSISQAELLDFYQLMKYRASQSERRLTTLAPDGSLKFELNGETGHFVSSPVEKSLSDLLASLRLDKFEPALRDFGVETVSDLKELMDEDFKEMGMKTLHIRRLNRSINTEVTIDQMLPGLRFAKKMDFVEYHVKVTLPNGIANYNLETKEVELPPPHTKWMSNLQILFSQNSADEKKTREVIFDNSYELKDDESYYDDILSDFYKEAKRTHEFMYHDVEECKRLVDTINAKVAETGIKFVDREFLPNNFSINRYPSNIKSMLAQGPPKGKFFRPPPKGGSVGGFAADFKEPAIIRDSTNPSDCCQGYMGNCWFVGQVASLATKPELVANALHPLTYSPGQCYMVKMRKDKKWHAVLVDEYFVRSVDDGGLYFIHSTDANELWPSILEKATAKVFGCYQDMFPPCALSIEPLAVFGGGYHSYFFGLKENERYDRLYSCLKEDNGCAHTSGMSGQNEAITENGVVGAHAYSVLDVYRNDEEKLQLVKLRNAWGNTEWTGDWSDQSDMWIKYPQIKEELMPPGSTEDDGVFWINWEDYNKSFASVGLWRPNYVALPGEMITEDRHLFGGTRHAGLDYSNRDFITILHGDPKYPVGQAVLGYNPGTCPMFELVDAMYEDVPIDLSMLDMVQNNSIDQTANCYFFDKTARPSRRTLHCPDGVAPFRTFNGDLKRSKVPKR